jgi:bacterioferritin
MKGNKKVLTSLQEVLTAEVTAINQYFVHAEMYANMGLTQLAATVKADSIQEMRHAEMAIERMLFLEGMPNMSTSININVGKTVQEMMKNDLALEIEAVAKYNAIMKIAVEANDNGTRDMMLMLLKEEEQHVDWLETQLSLIDQVGLQNYLNSQR